MGVFVVGWGLSRWVIVGVILGSCGGLLEIFQDFAEIGVEFR